MSINLSTKTGRNAPCPCGSGKKFKRCCLERNEPTDIAMALAEQLEQSPDMDEEQLECFAQAQMHARNHTSIDDFCGLTSTQMHQLLYAPFEHQVEIQVNTPTYLSASPVMAYLALLFEQAQLTDGKIKLTAKGNLPAKLVKAAAELLPKFAVAKLDYPASISEFQGITEDRFNALHYTRIVADVADIVYVRSGHLCFKKSALQQYQQHGINAFWQPMLEAALTQYNWGYLDSWSDHLPLATFWRFLIWRIRCHASGQRLTDELIRAFPTVLDQLEDEGLFPLEQQLGFILHSRFTCRFLQFWGFATTRRALCGNEADRKIDLLPLMAQTFVVNLGK